MGKNIKDYLHLYLGCEMTDGEKVVKLLSVGLYGWVAEGRENRVQGKFGYAGYKPILRPLSDMSDDEKAEVSEIADIFIVDCLIEAITNKTKYLIKADHSFELTIYLLKQGFDLFGLIESNLAIDKTKLNG